MNLQLFAEGDEDSGEGDEKPKKLEFTQEELDALIGREKGRVKSKYADYDELKAERDRLKAEEDARKTAELTETERLQAEKAEAERKAAEASERGDKALKAANDRVIRAEFRLLAKEAGVRADAVDDAYRLADLSGASVDDDGNVAGVDDVVAALLAAKPYLVAETKKEPRAIGGGTGGSEEKAEKTKEQLIAEAGEKARRTGRIEDRMAYAALKDELNK
ncbi:scaffolding protein [Paenibacillus algorifonticola]|uniref:phage scaffolding protein n=1 Tax=Paenibacillus algorifonticola TaxID=684063 RepID=UPI003D285BFC